MLTPTRKARTRTGGSLTARPEQVEALRQQLGQPSPGVGPRRSARQVEQLARRLLEADLSTEQADQEATSRQEGSAVLIEVLNKEDSESDGGSTPGGDGSRHRDSTSTRQVRSHRGERSTGEAEEGARSTRPATPEEEAEVAPRPTVQEAFEGYRRGPAGNQGARGRAAQTTTAPRQSVVL